MKKPNRNKLFRHLAFWIVVFFIEVSRSRFTFVDYGWETFRKDFMETILNMPVLLAASYFTVWILIPRFFKTRKYGRFLLIFLCSAIIFIFSMRAVIYYITLPAWYPGYLKAYPSFFHFNVFQHFFYIYSVVLFLVLMKTLEEFSEVLNRKEQLERENAESRLSLLRSQVNPHFLYNTLNNISALSRIDGEATADALQRLSGIMRYLMSEAPEQFVPLAKEIGFISDYIRLQELRMPFRNSVELKITGDDIKNQMIPSMVLIPFIENAFKHGRKDAGPPAIKIEIGIMTGKIILDVQNLKKPGHSQIGADHSGIGTENVRKRLQLLLPGRHSINISDDDQQYRIKLILEPNGTN
ncbi:MAG: hypothetical protein EOM90_13625 [Alphaproteobacteria bacterium]|nr:hypothetical protein [Alphaproteobacteria bacterium]